MTVWHNEIESYPADWTRNLMAAGLIPAGDVDERSILDVRPSDIAGYDTCHFFAGFGGWPYALRLAGWPEDRSVWTGSCPCQPFSVAGKQAGFDDPRHLWPAWQKLIAERLPPTIFGEQSAAASDWLNLVRSDLEALGYAVGCIPMEAASNDADHYRDRYWFVADRIGSDVRGEGYRSVDRAPSGMQGADGQRQWLRSDARTDGADVHSDVADRLHAERRSQSEGRRDDLERADAGRKEAPGRSLLYRQANDDFRNVADSASAGSLPGAHGGIHSGQEISGPWNGEPERRGVSPDSWGASWTEQQFRDAGFTAAIAIIDGRQYIECPDGKWRRLPPPRVRWLGDGIPARISKLRAIGNAIDHRPAAAFVHAYMKARGIIPDFGWRLAA